MYLRLDVFLLIVSKRFVLLFYIFKGYQLSNLEFKLKNLIY